MHQWLTVLARLPVSNVTHTHTHIQSDGSSTIVLKAMGRAINKAVTIAEILKRKMPLHQWNVLSSVEMIDVYEPVEEGLDIVTSRRYVSCMKITLSLTVPPMPASSTTTTSSSSGSTSAALDIHHSGYQPPLPPEEWQIQTPMAGGSIGSGGPSPSAHASGDVTYWGSVTLK
jgi:DNA-binding protein